MWRGPGSSKETEAPALMWRGPDISKAAEATFLMRWKPHCLYSDGAPYPNATGAPAASKGHRPFP